MTSRRCPPTATDIRPLLTQGGAYAYNNGGIVLSSTATATAPWWPTR
jgi:hypothetical protein